jgi:hypothetical protein
MGEACRRLAGICKPHSQPLSRAAAIAWAMEVLAGTEDETVSGVTLFPADGSDPIYLDVADAKRTPGRRH